MAKKLDTDSQIGRLINLVRPNPILYDETHEDYDDKEKKELLWVEIGKKLGTSSRISRRKWVGLMLKFRKREIEGEAVLIDEGGTPWPWYGKLQFVKKRIEFARPVVESTPMPEISNVVTSADTVNGEPEEKKVRPSSAIQSNSSTNLSGNKLFLESLVEDLSMLSPKDQYEFKRKVMELMQFYISKN